MSANSSGGINLVAENIEDEGAPDEAPQTVEVAE